ncbi:hypothetical protein [Erythrobacter crassostreae]|uniref:Uncharacterized protein n=1 Tax=Erythrobacter crassostreae TaxID=2828328 RepID=A0A9X1F2A7_9SPHN|nr:hypothetical protein [Erythrobacter crassostrea]MBV7258033.1 hypothetical protein [Erythrobacter crassostrea]
MSEGRLGAPVGGTEIGSFWRIFFWAAALFNFLIGLAGMLAPVPSIDERIIGLLVFCFGVIYALVARDPQRYAKVLWAGVIGKLGVVGLMLPTVLGGDGGALSIVILSLDAVFALGFLAFLFLGRSGEV